MAKQKTIIVTQTRSAIRTHKRQKATLQCLGLGKIGRSKRHVVSDELMGMIRKVPHLVQVTQEG